MKNYSHFILSLFYLLLQKITISEVKKMLVTKSFFFNEIERFKMEEFVLELNKGISEAEILELDYRELMELANNSQRNS